MFCETPVTIDFAGYADDNTPFVLDNLQEALEKKCFIGSQQITW